MSLSMMACSTLARANQFLRCVSVPSPAVGAHVNPAPAVMPTLYRWQGGRGQWRLARTSRIVIEPASAHALKLVANRLADDMAHISGIRPTVVIADHARRGDIGLSLAPCGDEASQSIGGEGYTLQVGRAVSLRANTINGVFYATRTLLQMMTMDSPVRGKHRSAPRGYALDFPRYHERAVMFDVGREFAPVAFLENYIRFMGWYKLNTLHLHLNDQVQVKSKGKTIWFSRAFRLKSNDPAFRKLIPADGKYYTRRDWDQLEAVAAANAVHIVPEIDTPGHAGAFVVARPDLAYKEGSPEGGTLDPANPGTLAYVESVWGQFLPWFHSRVVHIGGDEVNNNGGHVGIAAQVDYQNRLARFLQAHGKTVEVWGNDAGFARGLNRSLVVQRWITWGDTGKMNWGKLGFDWTQSSGTWYIIPTVHGLKGGGAALYDGWSHNPQNKPGRHGPRGGQIAVWNDHGNLDYSYKVTINEMLKNVIPAAGQIFWRGEAHVHGGRVLPYAGLQKRISKLQYGPDVSMFDKDPLQ